MWVELGRQRSQNQTGPGVGAGLPLKAAQEWNVHSQVLPWTQTSWAAPQAPEGWVW